MNKTVVLSMVLFVSAFTCRLLAAPIDLMGRISIMSTDEINAFDSEYANLLSYNSDIEKSPDATFLVNLIEFSCKNDSMQSYLFDAFMRSTKNKKVASFYSDYVRSHNKSEPQVQQILSILEARNQSYTPRVLTKDGKVFEGIDMFTLGQLHKFNGKLNVLVFSNNKYAVVSGNSTSSTSFFCGGDTNTIMVIFTEHATDKAKFLTEVVGSDFFKMQYDNWHVFEIQDANILRDYGAGAMWVGFGAEKKDLIRETVTLYVYSDKQDDGFEITWFTNISASSIFGDNPRRILLHIAEMALMNTIQN